MVKGRLFNHFQLQEIVTVAPDGQTAQARFRTFAQVAGFGSVKQAWNEGIYENLDSLTRKALKQKLTDHRQDAIASRELVTLRDDVPVDAKVIGTAYDGGNTAALRNLFSELELTRLLAQLEPAPAAYVDSCVSNVPL